MSPTQPATDILLAELAEVGFESFVETPSGLLAYIVKSDWHEGMVDDCYILKHPDVSISWSVTTLEPQNWNAVWEKSFTPVIVAGQCNIRAPFHTPKKVACDIVIEPKMSFGTGHHETTHMMVRHLLDTDCVGKSVLDMGCGTGILGILAKKKGATRVDAVDIDPGCVLNARDNVERNGCEDIRVFQGDSTVLTGKKYDLILANINRNSLLADIPHYAKCITPGGSLFLSGFYKEDVAAISSRCEAYGLTLEKKLEKNRWIAVKYVS